MTSNQPETESNPNPNPDPNPTTEQHAMVNVQKLNMCYVYPDKYIRDNIDAPFVQTSIVVVTPPVSTDIFVLLIPTPPKK